MTYINDRAIYYFMTDYMFQANIKNQGALYTV